MPPHKPTALGLTVLGTVLLFLVWYGPARSQATAPDRMAPLNVAQATLTPFEPTDTPTPIVVVIGEPPEAPTPTPAILPYRSPLATPTATPTRVMVVYNEFIWFPIGMR